MNAYVLVGAYRRNTVDASQDTEDEVFYLDKAQAELTAVVRNESPDAFFRQYLWSVEERTLAVEGEVA